MVCTLQGALSLIAVFVRAVVRGRLVRGFEDAERSQEAGGFKNHADMETSEAFYPGFLLPKGATYAAVLDCSFIPFSTTSIETGFCAPCR